VAKLGRDQVSTDALADERAIFDESGGGALENTGEFTLSFIVSKQRPHFLTQDGVAAAGTIQKGGALGERNIECVDEELLSAFPERLRAARS
jgi:hypothetical protein